MQRGGASRIDCCTFSPSPATMPGLTLYCEDVPDEDTCDYYEGTWASGSKCPEQPKMFGQGVMGVSHCGCTDSGTSFPMCTQMSTEGSLSYTPVMVRSTDDSPAHLFSQWARAYEGHASQLTADSNPMRAIKAFNANVALIKNYNKQPNSRSAELRLNENAATPSNEFRLRNGFSNAKLQAQLRAPRPPQPATPRLPLSLRATAPPPASLVLSLKGQVNKAKNQKQCGDCYIFSAVAVMEAAYARRTGKLLKFSEEYLLQQKQCNAAEPASKASMTTTLDCNGGLPHDVLQCIVNDGGNMVLAEDDPYTAGVVVDPYGSQAGGKKVYTKVRTGVTSVGSVFYPGFPGPQAPPMPKPNGWKPAPPLTVAEIETEIQHALLAHGPLAVAVATTDEWTLYYKGILQPPAVVGDLDHAVVLFGWGADTMGQKYWRIRNHWGEHWGEKGEIRVPKGGTVGVSGPFKMYTYNPAFVF